ncbi:MAG: hypothetical protein H0V23_03565 [Nocardioidaceae bacterium]|nr:hypothetical protein [Nocardioidaceae bacterium]
MDKTSRDQADPGGPAHTTPRWVKVSAVIAVVLVLAFGVMLLAGGGDHGPGRHSSSSGGQTSSLGGTEAGGHTPPAGGHTP